MSSYLSLTRLPGNRQLARLRQMPIPVACSLRQRPPLVGAAVAVPDHEAGAVLRTEPGVVQAQVVGPQHVLAVAPVRPFLVRAAVAGEQLELGAVAAGSRVVQALAEDPQLAVGREHPALRGGSVAGEQVDRVPVGGAAVEVVDALAGEAPDRAARRRRGRLR